MTNKAMFSVYYEGNDIFHAQQYTSIFSTHTIQHNDNRIKGKGVLIYENNIENLRRSISLFSIRSLAKHTWINDNDRFLGRLENTNSVYLALKVSKKDVIPF
jgi:hypothetical protein